MSKSFKKNPKCSNNIGSSKRVANKKVRKQLEISDGKQYRKVYNSCEISDYSDNKSIEAYRNDWKDPNNRLHSLFNTFEEVEDWYASTYLRK